MRTNKIIVGIDPGAKGAVAVFGPEGLDIWDLKDCISETGTFRSLDAVKLSKMFDSALSYTAGEIDLFCEESILIRNNGIKTARPIFDSRGVLRAVCALIQFIPPTTWKRFYGLLRADKAASVEKAVELLPKYADFFRKEYRGRIIDQDGRAEAALIALYGKTHKR